MIRKRHLTLARKFLAHRWKPLQVFEVQACVLNACNLRCVYCKCPEIKTSVLTTQQWRELIADLARLGTMRIKFQGGEPTLRPDFRELCWVSRAKGTITSVTTNGQRTAEEPTLLDYLDEAVFSLDAAESAVNDRLRGEGTHRKVMESIEQARRRGIRIYINMVVTRENLDQIEPMMRLCAEIGAGFNAQPMTLDWAYADDCARRLALNDDEILALHRQLVAWKRAGWPLMFGAATYQRSVDWPEYRQLRRTGDTISSCMAGRFYVHIEPNGDVFPCGFQVGHFEPINAVHSGIEQALEKARRHHCLDCGIPYLNERKALFGLHPYALAQLFRRG